MELMGVLVALAIHFQDDGGLRGLVGQGESYLIHVSDNLACAMDGLLLTSRLLGTFQFKLDDTGLDG